MASKFESGRDLPRPTLRLAGSKKQRTDDFRASRGIRSVISLREGCTEKYFFELFQLDRDKEGLGGLLITD